MSHEAPWFKNNQKKKQNPPKEGKNPCADFQWEDQSNEVALCSEIYYI